MSISILPDLCLLNIFDRIPLQNLDSSQLVCQRWNCLCSSAVYKRRRTLALAIGQKPMFDSFQALDCMDFLPFSTKPPFPGLNDSIYKRFERNLFEYETLEQADTDKLMRTFGSITNLIIDFFDDNFAEKQTVVRQVMQLIKQWSSSLKTLHYSGINTTDPQQMFDSINSIRPLRNLSFNLYPSVDVSQINFPILSQLNRLYFANSTCEIGFYDWIWEHVQSDQPIQIVYEGDVFQKELAAEICEDEEDSSQLDKFVYLQPTYKMNYRELLYFCAHLPSLTNLHINILKLSLFHLSDALALLPNLASLTLFCTDTRKRFPAFSRDNNLPSQHFSALASVERLTLEFDEDCIRNHFALNSTHLATVFPNVRFVFMKVYFYHFSSLRCSICKLGLDIVNDIEHYEQICKIKKCYKKLAKPFKQCPKLERVYFQYDYSDISDQLFSWSAKELSTKFNFV